MTTLIAPCGLDCAQCEAYLLTQADDQPGKEALLVKWRVEFNAPEMTIEDITCDGCLAASGLVGGYCRMCEIRACALGKSLATCAECQDYACEKLEKFWETAQPAKDNLETLRKSM
ncbi:MAG: DUF3795 domain-containing protein [Anaerolineales bacterium]|nr:DUF3795 domain-containing protein [Anaerolineales bacterium]